MNNQELTRRIGAGSIPPWVGCHTNTTSLNESKASLKSGNPAEPGPLCWSGWLAADAQMQQRHSKHIFLNIDNESILVFVQMPRQQAGDCNNRPTSHEAMHEVVNCFNMNKQVKGFACKVKRSIFTFRSLAKTSFHSIPQQNKFLL